MELKKIKIESNITVFCPEIVNNELLEKALYFLKLSDCKNDINLIKSKNAKKRTRHVFRFEVSGKTYFCKKYANNSLFKKIQDLFRNQRAIRAFKLSVFLNNNNIHTIKPVLAATYKNNFIFEDSIFISEECRGITIKNRLLNEITKEKKNELIENSTNLYISLINMNIYHRDPNLSNLMISHNELTLIDLDDIKRIPFYSFITLFLNLEKFNRILLLSYIRNKKINFTNKEREEIIKKIIASRYKRIDQKRYLEMLNLFTRFRMKKHFKTPKRIKRYLKGETIKAIDDNLFNNQKLIFQKIIRKIII